MRINSRSWQSVSRVLLISFLSGNLEPVWVYAGTETSTAIVPYTPQVSSVLNQAAGSSFATGFTNIFASCFNFSTPTQALGGALAQMAVPGAAGVGSSMMPACQAMSSISISTPCPGSAQVPQVGANLDCSTMTPAIAQQATMMLQTASCALQCQKAKSEAIQAEVQCLQAASQSMVAQASSMTGLMQQAVQLAQKQVMAFEQVKQDDMTKSQQVEELLGSGSAGGQGGGTGLMAVAKQIKDQIAEETGLILQAQNNFKNYTQGQNVLNSFIQSRTSGLMLNCFQSRPIDSYRCTPNGPPVSAAEYLSCRYKQTQVVGNNGMIEQNKLIQGKAQAGAQSLDALIQQIGGDAASDANVPSDPANLMKGNTSNAMLVNSPDDVRRLYGGQLGKYSIGNQSAKDFVDGVMKYCYGRATQTVAAEKANPGSAIGVQQNQLQEQANQVDAQIRTEYQKLSNSYTKALGVMTGENYPLNAPECVSGPTQGRINCLRGVQNRLQGILTGKADEAKITRDIQGSLQSQPLRIQCSGLDGCISRLQTVSRELKAHYQQQEAQRQVYVMNQNQQIENFQKAVAQQLSVQSSFITQKLQELNAAIGLVGGRPVTPRTIQGEELRTDSAGLLQAPSNALKAIARYIQPPMPDMSDAGLVNSMGGAVSGIDSRIADLNSQMMTIQNKWPACDAQRKQALIDNINQIGAYNCHDAEFCKNGGTQLQSHINDIVAAVGQNPTLIGSVSTLQTGRATVCEDRAKSAVENKLVELYQKQYPGKDYTTDPNWQTFRASNQATARIQATVMNPELGTGRLCDAYMSSLLGAKGVLTTPAYGSQSTGGSLRAK